MKFFEKSEFMAKFTGLHVKIPDALDGMCC